MGCFGLFYNDRTCELCQQINAETFSKCREARRIAKEKSDKIRETIERCPYRTDGYDEYTHFYACSKNGNGYGRCADECKATEACLKMIQEFKNRKAVK